MKRNFLILLLAVYLCLSACSLQSTNDDNEIADSESSSQPTVQSSQSPEISNPYLEESDNVSLDETAREYIEFLDSLLLSEWESPGDISPMNFVMWYGYQIQNLSIMENYRIDGRDGLFFPYEEFEAEIKKYFDVSIEYLRSDPNVYLKDEHLYRIPAALTPLAETSYDITDVNCNGSIIKIEFSFNLVEKKLAKEMILTLEKVDGDIQFLSYSSKS